MILLVRLRRQLYLQATLPAQISKFVRRAVFDYVFVHRALEIAAQAGGREAKAREVGVTFTSKKRVKLVKQSELGGSQLDVDWKLWRWGASWLAGGQRAADKGDFDINSSSPPFLNRGSSNHGTMQTSGTADLRVHHAVAANVCDTVQRPVGVAKISPARCYTKRGPVPRRKTDETHQKCANRLCRAGTTRQRTTVWNFIRFLLSSLL